MLITGPTGIGKSLTARAVKNDAARAKQVRACAFDFDRRLLEITSPDLWRLLARLRRELDPQ